MLHEKSFGIRVGEYSRGPIQASGNGRERHRNWHLHLLTTTPTGGRLGIDRLNVHRASTQRVFSKTMLTHDTPVMSPLLRPLNYRGSV
ncbi:hypothetical protein TNCV_3252851 [Trichonephila clavipes]|nr:hypothetical protein TNCV_3252851 [Trichonephila clavipes]